MRKLLAATVAASVLQGCDGIAEPRREPSTEVPRGNDLSAGQWKALLEMDRKVRASQEAASVPAVPRRLVPVGPGLYFEEARSSWFEEKAGVFREILPPTKYVVAGVNGAPDRVVWVRQEDRAAATSFPAPQAGGAGALDVGAAAAGGALAGAAGAMALTRAASGGTRRRVSVRRRR